MTFKVISGYKFFHLTNALEIRFPLREFCRAHQLKGSILLSSEGVNSFVAGTSEAIQMYKDHVHKTLGFPSFVYKENDSDHQPFTRMLVKIKKEIISMGMPEIKPEEFTGPALSPRNFKSWLDEGRDVVVVDTRNDYEVQLGKFKNALDLKVGSFREFAQKAATLNEDIKSKPVVMYCTGGIRCEKASALFLQKYGFKEVYQLEGGILNYFKEVGGDHFEGECFVFDQRVALNSSAKETETDQCYACRAVLTVEELSSSDYIPFKHCPHCKSGTGE
jgi:predicted sulfurtransferase